jgi:hypothetical protein
MIFGKGYSGFMDRRDQGLHAVERRIMECLATKRLTKAGLP